MCVSGFDDVSVPCLLERWLEALLVGGCRSGYHSGTYGNSQWSGCYMHCTEGSRGWAVYLPAAALFGCSAYAGHYEVGSKMRRSARFWADGITGCSTIATSVQALRGALCLARTRSVGLSLLDAHARLLGLQVLDIIDTAMRVACRGGAD